LVDGGGGTAGLGGGSDGHGDNGSTEMQGVGGGGVTGTTVHFLVGANRPPHVAPYGKNAG
jgi:hypothetical protein